MTFDYPVFLDLHDVPVLVVGAGPVGVRKVAGLVAAGAAVTVVARTIDPALDRSTVVAVHERDVVDRDLDGVRLVVTATGDPPVDAGVAAAARARDIWVNAADRPDDCGFILPAIARRGSVTIAVSTDGASPALAGYLRDHLAADLPEGVAEIAEQLAAERRAVKAGGDSTEGIDWRTRIDALLGEQR